jgi:uncharacterized DUF497 family protein
VDLVPGTVIGVPVLTLGTHMRIMYYMVFDWNQDKIKKLSSERGITFEEIVIAIQNNGLVRKLKHPNPEKYNDQELLLVLVNSYIYVVPAITTNNGYFLKTIYKSRKYTKLIFGGENYEE